MPFVWTGVIMLIMKWAEFGPVANLSWWWVLSPFAVALVWFEVLQPMLGKDRIDEDKTVEIAKKARIARAFAKDSK